MRYCTCQTPGCRHEEDLVLCDRCEALVCGLHSVPIGHGRRRCRACAGAPLQGAPQPRQPEQRSLF